MLTDVDTGKVSVEPPVTGDGSFEKGFAMKYRRIICLIAACLPILGSGPASAVPVTYLQEFDNVSGTLQGIGFSNQDLVFSAAGDTNNITFNPNIK
jgi:hypothetical protein